MPLSTPKNRKRRFMTQDVLDAILTPVTLKEINEKTGFTEPQTLDAIKRLREQGCDIRSIGVNEHKHYYLPKSQRPGKIQLKEQELIDLVADTEEWWTKDEIKEILGLTNIQFKNYIARIKYKGYSVKVHFHEEHKTSYWISSTEEMKTVVEQLEEFLTGEVYHSKEVIKAKFGFNEKEFTLRMGTVRRRCKAFDKIHLIGNKVSYRIVPEGGVCEG